MTDLTVIFSTYNGEDVLRRVLTGYTCQVKGPFSWKMVIIDNGSTDGTKKIFQDFYHRLPLEICDEPIPGKNCALNRGLNYVEGSAIILTDDDAIPDADFLSAWNDVLMKNEGYDLFGGSVKPIFDIAPPDWFTHSRPQFAPLYAENHLIEGSIEARHIFGPNMAVRRKVFDAGLRFDESIGPDACNKNYSMGSETEFCVRAEKYGHKAWFSGAPRVSHIVRANQVTAVFWAQRAYRHGRGVAQQHYENGLLPKSIQHFDIRHTMRGAYFCLNQTLRRFGSFSPFPLQRFNNLWEYHWQRGFKEEYAKRQSKWLAQNKADL